MNEPDTEVAAPRRGLRRIRVGFDGAAVGALGLLTVGDAVWVAVGGGKTGQAALVGDIVILPFGLAATVLSFAAALRLRRSLRQMTAWLLLASAFLAFWLGDVLWFRYDAVLNVAPFPSWADAGYLAYYPLLLAGIFLLSRRATAMAGRAKVALDGLTILLGGGMFVWYFMLVPVLGTSNGLTLALSAAYPIGDLLLLLGIATIALRKVAVAGRIVLLSLLVGIFLGLLTDVLYSYGSLNGTYRSGGWVDLGYLVSWFFFALAAQREFRRRSPKSDIPAELQAQALSERASFLPIIASVAGFGLLLFSLRHQMGAVQGQLAIGAVAISLLVLVRQTAANREVMRLREEKAARESAERFESLVKNASDVVTLLDSAGVITYVTPSVEKLLGCEPVELMGVPLGGFLHDSDVPQLAGLLAELMCHPETTTRREWRLRHGDGTWRPTETVGTNLLADPRVGGIVLTTRDVSERKRAEEELERREAHFRGLIENSSDLIAVIDSRGIIQFQSPSCSRTLGYEPEELEGRQVFDFVHPEDLVRSQGDFERLMQDKWQPSTQVETRFRHKDGSWQTFEVMGKRLVQPTGELVCVLNSRDITERKRAEQELAKREERFRELIENSSDLIAVMDSTGVTRFQSPSSLRTLGYRPEEVVGQNAFSLVHPRDRARALKAFARLVAGEWDGSQSEEVRFLHKDGSWRVLEVMGRRLDGEADDVLCVLNSRDVTEHKLWEEALRHQALHDSTTGLANRAALRDRLQSRTHTGRRKARPFALCVLDLDSFKEINDTFGHHTGDALLRQIAYRLQKNLRSADMVARLGGDEFGVIVELERETQASSVAIRILDALEPAYEVESQKLSLSASVGMALYPLHGSDADSLLRFADVAMYAAKQGGGARYAIYDIQKDPHSRDRIAVHSELRAAFERDELVLYYQPQVELRTGRIVGLEALTRWQHPRRGLVLPGDFLEAIEHDGLSRALTSWVMRSAVDQWAEWRSAGFAVGMAINLSARDLDDPELVSLISSLGGTGGVWPRDLTVELTETSIMLDPRRSIDTLARIRALGVKVAVDDFGQGQSTLGYLRELPLDQMKIDKSFVLNMAVERQDAAIVRSTIALGHDLGLAVVAEGVENVATMKLLKAFGCDIIQGYHLGPPMPARSVAARLSEARTPARRAPGALAVGGSARGI